MRLNAKALLTLISRRTVWPGLSFDSCCHAHERDEDAAAARSSTNRSDAAGWTLSKTDIVRAQAVASKQVGAIDRTATPPFAEERETLEG